MKILVTGGAGLIGSNIVKRLIDDSADIIVADNLWRGKLENLLHNGQKSLDIEKNFFKYDLSDYEKCLKVTKDVDAVIHLADIVAGINFVFSNELFTFRNNCLINSNVLAASIENNVKRFVYVGTACSYPIEKQNRLNLRPLKEEDAYPANPESGYGWSKLMGEYECELAQKEGKIEVSVLRLHNVYGPPCELSQEKSQVIPSLCRKAILYPNEKFIVWGSGTQRRTFIYVRDVVDALMATLDSGMGKGVIQIGTTESHSIANVAEKITGLSNKEIEIIFDLAKPEGDKDRVADSTKAEKILGWQPKVSLEEGLEETYLWAKQKLES